MKMFLQLVLAQCLLLAAAAPAVENSDDWKLEFRGGHYNDDKNYMVIENKTLTGVLTGIGRNDTYVMWKLAGEPVENVTITRTQLEGGNYLFTSEVHMTATRNIGKIRYSLVNPLKPNNSLPVLAGVHVLYQVPPEIKIKEGEENFQRLEDGAYQIREDEQFLLECTGGGNQRFELRWVDSAGLPLESTESTQLGKLNPTRVNHKPQAVQSVNVTATRGMTAFGCQLTEQYFPSPLTTWFNFTVKYTAIVDLLVNSTDCEQVTFSCQANDPDTEKVTFIALHLLSVIIIYCCL